MDWHYPIFASPGSFWVPTLVPAGLYGVRYVVFAGAAYVIGYRCGGALHLHKLQPSMPAAQQMLREFRYSGLSVLLFGAVAGTLSALGALSHTLLYRDTAQHGWTWFVLDHCGTGPARHDFYWTHRWLHVRPIFRAVYRVSRCPCIRSRSSLFR